MGTLLLSLIVVTVLSSFPRKDQNPPIGTQQVSQYFIYDLFCARHMGCRAQIVAKVGLAYDVSFVILFHPWIRKMFQCRLQVDL